jgi:hypothetical protein
MIQALVIKNLDLDRDPDSPKTLDLDRDSITITHILNTTT